MNDLAPSIRISREVWLITSDGARFPDTAFAKANAHQLITHQVEKAMARLRSPPTEVRCSFLNGEGYIQQTPQKVEEVRKELGRITATACADTGPNVNPSYALRLLNGSHPALEAAWVRIMCINPDSSREYGSPYYATRESESKGGPL